MMLSKKFGVRAFVMSSLIVLAGCGGGTSARSQAAGISRINAVEPGDSTKSCEELTASIKDMDGKIDILEEALSDAQSSANANSAMTDMVISNAYAGAYGSMFGPVQSMLGSQARGADQKTIQDLNFKYQNAQQRRSNLTQNYNQRCF